MLIYSIALSLQFEVCAISLHIEITTRKHKVFYCCCFTDQTLQILQQAENQLVNPSSSRLKRREIPELSNPQDLVQMLENIQGRLLG